MKTKSIGFIGGGRITKIFLQAFQNKQIKFDSVTVCDTNEEVLKALKSQFPNIETCFFADLPAKQDLVFIALHPPMIMDMLDKIRGMVSEQSLLISLAPKISIEKIAAKLDISNIARMIPNATSFINEGYNPISFSPSFSAQEKNEVTELLETLGKTFEVDEAKLESYALISAMLPTYFWFQYNELQGLGGEMGLSEVEAQTAIKETLLAANHLFFDSGLSSEQVIDLIPVRPIGESEDQIKDIYHTRLMGLFEKIKP